MWGERDWLLLLDLDFGASEVRVAQVSPPTSLSKFMMSTGGSGPLSPCLE